MNFGKYYIGQDFSEIAESVTEIPVAYYAVMKRTFKDEIIFNANDTTFCDTVWKTVIGVTQGKVYKISLQTPGKLYPVAGNLIWNKVFSLLNEELSNFTDQQRVGNAFLTTWVTTWGNVVLNSTSLSDEIETSSSPEEVIDITVTGRFAFNNAKSNTNGGCMSTLLILAGLTISISVLFLAFIFKLLI